MKVCIFTLGSRGDVQPYIALSKELIRQGHCAVICTGESFRDLVEKNGIEFYRTESDLMAFADTEDGKAILEAPLKNWKLAVKYSKELLNPAYRKTLDDFYFAAGDADIIVYHPKALGAVDISRYYGIPCVSIPPVPITYPISEFPMLALTRKNLGSMMNKFSYQINMMAEQSQISEINDFREKTLKLPKRKAGIYTYNDGTKEIPIIYPISRYLFPDVRSWDGHVFLTGFFYLENEERLEPDLDAFLSEKEKPIVITFSSMPLKKPEVFLAMLRTALKETNNRAVLLTGNSGIKVVSDSDMYVAAAVPHLQLFPGAKGILHHGGIGTLAAAIRSAVPQVMMPGSVDQPFWAERMYKLGYTQKPLYEKNVSVDVLIRAFQEFDNPALCDKAFSLGKMMQSENGVANAVKYLEQLVDK